MLGREVVRASQGPALVARVVSRWELRYSMGGDALEDRPAHVRAGSGIAWFDGRLAVVQDDANFIALVNPATKVVEFMSLPRGPGGRRQFDDLRGNKSDKLDLESCAVGMWHGRETLFAFGSGSTPAREQVAVVQGTKGTYERRLVSMPTLYAALRDCRAFSGSELNVEGVVIAGGRLRFFQRGNGQPRAGISPISASGDIAWEDFLETLSGSTRRPRVENVCTYDLGALSGTALTFTDAAPAPNGATLYLATAEASPDAVHDGPVTGSAVGILSEGAARQAVLVDATGAPFEQKAEGIVLSRHEHARAFVVIDADDAERPAELCEVVLSGPWW